MRRPLPRVTNIEFRESARSSVVYFIAIAVFLATIVAQAGAGQSANPKSQSAPAGARKQRIANPLNELLDEAQRDIEKKDFQAAIDHIAGLPSGLFNTYQLVHDEKQAELCFYCVLAYFRKKDYRKAHKYLSYAFKGKDAYPQLAIYKALRLLNMIIHYEQKDTEYLSYDIRAYKRSADPRTGLSRTEKIIFKIIQEKPFANTRHQNNILAKKLKKDIDALSTDKYELQLLKYMDFLQWINQKLGLVNP